MQESGKGMYVDSSRGVDITQTDMKKSMQQKSKEAKKFAKVYYIRNSQEKNKIS